MDKELTKFKESLKGKSYCELVDLFEPDPLKYRKDKVTFKNLPKEWKELTDREKEEYTQDQKDLVSFIKYITKNSSKHKLNDGEEDFIIADDFIRIPLIRLSKDIFNLEYLYDLYVETQEAEVLCNPEVIIKTSFKQYLFSILGNIDDDSYYSYYVCIPLDSFYTWLNKFDYKVI